jgi:Family of unknown function (DUF6188)
MRCSQRTRDKPDGDSPTVWFPSRPSPLSKRCWWRLRQPFIDRWDSGPTAAGLVFQRVYGLDADLDLSFFEGCELIQVAVGHEVILHFTSGVSITIGARIQIDRGDVMHDSRTAGTGLLALLGAAIETATGTADGTLTIGWRNARRRAIFESWSDHESYTVTSPGRTIVV